METGSSTELILVPVMCRQPQAEHHFSQPSCGSLSWGPVCSHCASCTLEPNQLKPQSLEQRRVLLQSYARRWLALASKNPELPERSSQITFKEKYKGVF